MALRLAVANDPVERLLADDTAADHAKAEQRGQRCLLLACSIASAMDAGGMLRGPQVDVVAEIFHLIADDLYGNAAVNLPVIR